MKEFNLLCKLTEGVLLHIKLLKYVQDILIVQTFVFIKDHTKKIKKKTDTILFQFYYVT
jgi:hypothetical protein